MTSCFPNILATLVYENTMIHYSIAYEPVGTDKSFLQDIRVVLFNWDWLANFSRYNIPSSVLVTVQSWIVGFLGTRCLNS